jgi:PAS domain-containing protein
MFFDAEGRPERMVGFMIDVTDRRQAEEELRAADAALRRTRVKWFA